MKLIIPFDQQELFTVKELSLLGHLSLDPTFIVNQALQDWTLYSYGEVSAKYENTVDAVYDQIFVRTQHNPQLMESMENILVGNADTLTKMIAEMAVYLNRVLNDIPDEIVRASLSSDVYHFLTVEKIDVAGRFATLVSHSEPMYA